MSSGKFIIITIVLLFLYAANIFASDYVYVRTTEDLKHNLKCGKTLVLEADINLGIQSQGFSLLSSIEGHGHTIKISGQTNDLFYVDANGITIRNTTLSNESQSQSSNRRVLYVRQGQFSLQNSVVRGTLYCSPSGKVPLTNITITGNNISCNFSNSVKSSHNQNDVLTFRGCHTVRVENNVINAINANRVLKSCCAWPAVSGKYNPSVCTRDVIVSNNTITSQTDCGKQLWDMYDGTVNVTVKGNTIKSYGHTYCFENKTTFDNGINNKLRIEKNLIISDWKLLFLNTNAKYDELSFLCNEVHIVGHDNDITDARGYHKTREYFIVVGGVKNALFKNNTFIREDAVSDIGTFFLQLSSNIIHIRKNKVEGFSSAYVSKDADIHDLTFKKNTYKNIADQELELSLNGVVHSLYYQSSGFGKTSVKASQKAMESCEAMTIIPSKKTRIALEFKKTSPNKSLAVKIEGFTLQNRNGIVQYIR